MAKRKPRRSRERCLRDVSEAVDAFWWTPERLAQVRGRFRPVGMGRRVVRQNVEGGPDLFPRCRVLLSDGTRYLLHIDHPAVARLKPGALVPPGTVWARPWSPRTVMWPHWTEAPPPR